MEFSSFSTGIEHAVKTWQAAIGTREDGIMTAELLERLYMKQQFEDGGTNLSSDQEATTMFPQIVEVKTSLEKQFLDLLTEELYEREQSLYNL